MRVDWIKCIYLIVAAPFFYFGCRSIYRSKSLNSWDMFWLIMGFALLVKFMFTISN
jgi:hypothetical protein